MNIKFSIYAQAKENQFTLYQNSESFIFNTALNENAKKTLNKIVDRYNNLIEHKIPFCLSIDNNIFTEVLDINNRFKDNSDLIDFFICFCDLTADKQHRFIRLLEDVKNLNKEINNSGLALLMVAALTSKKN